ncbi:hypothetical protein [Paenibacillus sp. MMO-177]|uniref:hypothetical protein n=1 Tax=Paenibacillus sp. MMO-177 TaxID=3081289 RepID=UPI0030178D8A
MNGFEAAHVEWLKRHLAKRTGERKGRLERGHQHAEKLFLQQVWWPLMGTLEDLHPEYEILDWRGKPYYADMAWLPGHVKFVFEIKGFGPHVADMDRKRYSEELNRETFMQGIGFRVVSFSYDDVAQRPDLCQTLLRLLLSRYQSGKSKDLSNRIRREIILLAHENGGSVRPAEVECHLQLNHRTAVRHLQALCGQGRFQALLCDNGKSSKVMKYSLLQEGVNEIDRW